MEPGVKGRLHWNGMSAPLVPSPLDYIGPREFAFHPPIGKIKPNLWRIRARLWSEVEIVNHATGIAIWIPWQYIGAVGENSDGLLIVGLNKELDFRGGRIQPRFSRVIEMPASRSEEWKPRCEVHRPPGPAPVIGIRVEPRGDSPMNKALITFGISALLVSLLAAIVSVFTRN